VHLLLGVGEVLELLPELQARVDRFLVGEMPLSSDPPRALVRLCKGLARLAGHDALLQAPASMAGLTPALAAAGFAIEEAEEQLRARYRPRFGPRGRTPPEPAQGERHALVIGAGLAGCATVAALAEQGWHSTLVDRHAAPAQEASGNPAGLFHGIVNPQDGAHARFNRAAALAAQRAVQRAIDDGGVRGSARGLLRLETGGRSAGHMQCEIDRLRLPPDYVQALDAAQASARCGLALRHPAWFYPGGGWVQPAALARALLQRAGQAADFRGGLQVQALRRAAAGWQALDAAGRVLAEAGTVVLANAADALRLLDAARWPVRSVRGQISLWRRPEAAVPRAPMLPLAGAGYLLPDIGGQLVFGATSQPGDVDPALREADHAYNLQRLGELCAPAWRGPPPRPSELQGRVGWRCVADDRLPLIGAAPAPRSADSRGIERARDLPRQEGLHVFAGLGSRGISWAVLGGQLLAARISGAALPLEASLVEAVDPGRFELRAARRRGVGGAAASGPD
jgi:tRNA 5-methylaminomethyl-2-thiouridine biosynthesis bifunctional protein